MVFVRVYKVYTRFSVRRFTRDLQAAHAHGLIARRPHDNSVCRSLADPALPPLLKPMVTASSLPLKAVETAFAVDSSAFSTSRFVRWSHKKYGREIDNREGVKVRLMCGVRTHIVTGVDVSGWTAHDTPFSRPLVEATAQPFRIGAGTADQAYLSHANRATVERVGGTARIPFKVNTVEPPVDAESVWSRMYHHFLDNRADFLKHSHQRPNVETVFSVVKGKFGDARHSKGDTAQINEVLCEVLCHNLCVLVQAMIELGIAAPFDAA